LIAFLFGYLNGEYPTNRSSVFFPPKDLAKE